MVDVRRTPHERAGYPPGLANIVVNEAAERFSYAGMHAVLFVYMTQHLVAASGAPDALTPGEASAWFHAFAAAVYFFPLLGSVLSDALLGKYRTIYALSLVYCCGHLALALSSTRTGLALGLGLVAIGAGGIKPCVSAHLGDQFGQANKGLLERVYGVFYLAIQVGGAASALATPWLLAHHGPHVAFAVPGLLMLLATLVFRAGRGSYVHVPPGGWAFLRELCGREGLRCIGRLAPLYGFVSLFWALAGQTGSSWIPQAARLDREVLGLEVLPAQVQAVAPIFTLVMIPVVTYGIYPALGKIIELTAVRRIGLGMAVMAGVFGLGAWIEAGLARGLALGIGWQLLAHLLAATAEIFVAVTCIELSYTTAPPRMKALVMALFALSVSLGNAFTSAVNFALLRDDGALRLAGEDYYLFFAGVMALGLALFVPFARWFEARDRG